MLIFSALAAATLLSGVVAVGIGAVSVDPVTVMLGNDGLGSSSIASTE
jgi:hypothetical protein